MTEYGLEGKVALVTGASRGIGEAIALSLCRKGARCVLVSRKVEGLHEVLKKIKAENGDAIAVPCNMGDMGQIKSLMDEVCRRYGTLDILVNNAAANPYFGEMINAEEWAWDKINNVNLKGPFFLTSAAAKLMKESGGGTVINVSSVNGVKPALMQGIYSITKAGLISMTQAFAKELAVYGIRVNALLPGLTDTKFAGAITENEDIRRLAMEKIPMARIARPEEMVGAVLYLASDLSSYTTGSCITCDGGMLS